MDWQSLTAAAIVALTAAIFLVRLLIRRRSGSTCGSSCHCDQKSKPTPAKRA